jgi:branched-chain amino acid transport system substrate-binding protein
MLLSLAAPVVHRPLQIVLLLPLVALAACTPRAEGAVFGSSASIGIGATPGKPGYEAVTRGVSLAIERLNAESAGHFKLTLRTPDAGAASAVQIAQQLRDDPAVIAVVGHPESGSSLEAIPVYSDAEHGGANAIVSISPTASSPRLSGASPWFFRVAPSDNDAARLVARYVADSLDAHTAAIVYRNDPYGRDWSARFGEAFADRKGVVTATLPYLTGITEWTAYALQLAKNTPQVLLFPGDADDAAAMLRALRAANVRLTFIGGDGTEGLSRTHEFPEARYAAFFIADRVVDAEGKRFVELYRARYNEAPDMFAALSYDATLAVGATLAKGARTRRAVRDGLEKMNAASGINGAGGRIAFNAQHDVVGRAVVVTTVGSGAK